MTMSQIFDNHYKELTEKERLIIETSDQFTLDDTSFNFDTVQDFKDFVKEYF